MATDFVTCHVRFSRALFRAHFGKMAHTDPPDKSNELAFI
jgi:hypothetical protein